MNGTMCNNNYAPTRCTADTQVVIGAGGFLLHIKSGQPYGNEVSRFERGVDRQLPAFVIVAANTWINRV